MTGAISSDLPRRLPAWVAAVLMMSLAAGAGAAQQSLRVGERLPTLKGQFLTGRNAALPEASSGKVTLIAMGFTYASRVPVEARLDR